MKREDILKQLQEKHEAIAPQLTRQAIAVDKQFPTPTFAENARQN